jgi:glycosyltransferase involved in cell wall biosynthesis
MIVKNEANIIYQTLQNLHSKIKLDYIVISDTGSTDNTIEIINNFFKENNIPGEIYSDKWIDFGTNRSIALKEAYKKADYILIFDADDSIEGQVSLPNTLVDDCYLLNFGTSNNKYTRICLVKNNIK